MADQAYDCQQCGYHLSSFNEFHPHGFCLLVKQGRDPYDEMRQAGADLTKPLLLTNWRDRTHDQQEMVEALLDLALDLALEVGEREA